MCLRFWTARHNKPSQIIENERPFLRNCFHSEIFTQTIFSMTTMKPGSIDEYIAAFPNDVQAVLEQIRATIQKTAPDAEETIKYGMPTFTLKGNLVYFAAYKKHIGFYPAPTGNEEFKEALANYKTGKGSVQFPLDKPMPLELIVKMVEWRVKQNTEKAGKKKSGARPHPK